MLYYNERTIEELDQYYQIDTDEIKYPWWKHKECERIQRAFKTKNIFLTLSECKIIYEIYSDECYCAGWEGGLEYLDDEEIFKLLFPWLLNVINDRVDRIYELDKEITATGLLDKNKEGD